MRLEYAASILTSLLVADPVVSQVLSQRQKKERTLDSDLLKEKEDANKLHRGQSHTKSFHDHKRDNVHYQHVGARKKKEKMRDVEHLLDAQDSLQEQSNDEKAKTKLTPTKVATVPTKQLRASNRKQASHKAFSADSSSLLSIPDVGILAADYKVDQETALTRNLQNTRKKRRKKAARKRGNPPKSCFEEIPAMLRKGGATFAQPYCDVDDETVMGYWNIQDGKSFFFGGYCTCAVECGKAKTTHCCAKACLLCDKSKAFSAKCGQFTAADFGG